jgi:hypothetical protein
MERQEDGSEIVILPGGWFFLRKESCAGTPYFALCRPDGSAVSNMQQQDASDFLLAIGLPIPRGRWPLIAK